ncbi:hypothetical protein ABE288_05825 [Bacillus salipaludis]|uniref:hypothetical protein n=1 Tax=Bacillus salipaludis TaxID=2547811 RepID=UPI003D1E7CE0
MRRIAIMIALLTFLCSTTAFAQTAKNLSSAGESISKEKNELYEMTKAGYTTKIKYDDIMKDSYLNDFSYGIGTSKLSLDSLAKKIAAARKKDGNYYFDGYLGFKSYLTKTDTKHYLLEIIPIVGVQNILSYDFREELPYEQYLLSQNKNKTVNIVFRKCYIENDGGMWWLNNGNTPTFDYNLIRKVGAQRVKTYPVPSSVKKRVSDGITVRGIERKYNLYSLNKSREYLNNGKGYPVPKISLYKKEGKNTIVISASGHVLNASDYKWLVNDFNKKKVPLIKHGSYKTYTGFEKYSSIYSQTSFFKAKDGKHYLESFITVKYSNNNNRVPMSIIKKYKKDIDKLREESNLIIKRNPS